MSPSLRPLRPGSRPLHSSRGLPRHVMSVGASWRPRPRASLGPLPAWQISLWYLKQPAYAVRPLFGVVSLTGCGPVKLPNTGGIGGGGVHLHPIVVELEGKRLQDALDQLQALLVVGQIHPVEQVVPVARIGHDRFRPASLS